MTTTQRSLAPLKSTGSKNTNVLSTSLGTLTRRSEIFLLHSERIHTEQVDHLGDEAALCTLVERFLQWVVDAGAEEGKQPRRIILGVQLDLQGVEVLPSMRVLFEQPVQVLQTSLQLLTLQDTRTRFLDYNRSSAPTTRIMSNTRFFPEFFPFS